MAITTTPTTHLDRIAALLRQAESTTHEAERDAFLSKAQRLATLGAIDLDVARAHVPAHERKETPAVEHISIGKAGAKGLATYVELFMAIGRANDLRFTIARNSTYVNAFGFPSDIEATKMLYASLVVQMVTASDAYIRSGEYKTEQIWTSRKDAWGYERSGYFPVHGSSARISFQRAFAHRVGARLAAARTEAVNERIEADTEAGDTSTALVLADKSKTVSAFYNATNNARGHWKGSSAGRSRSAALAGNQAGSSARLSAPRGLPGARGEIR